MLNDYLAEALVDVYFYAFQASLQIFDVALYLAFGGELVSGEIGVV